MGRIQEFYTVSSHHQIWPTVNQELTKLLAIGAVATSRASQLMVLNGSASDACMCSSSGRQHDLSGHRVVLSTLKLITTAVSCPTGKRCNRPTRMERQVKWIFWHSKAFQSLASQLILSSGVPIRRRCPFHLSWAKNYACGDELWLDNLPNFSATMDLPFSLDFRWVAQSVECHGKGVFLPLLCHLQTTTLNIN